MRVKKLSEYGASNIKVLSNEESLEHDFVLIDYLATKYCKPVEWVKRSVEACRLCNVDPRDYFVERYLKNNKSIPMNHEVNEVSREIQKKLSR